MKKNSSYFIGIVLISIGVLGISTPFFLKEQKKKEESKWTQTFFIETTKKNVENKSEEVSDKKNPLSYIAVVEIPKLGLKRGLFNIDDPNNTIEKNIAILKNSDMPDQELGLFMLAAHSGNTSISYFNDLEKLEIGDFLFVYYNGIRYTYEIYLKEYQDKKKYIHIQKNKEKKELLLTTCATKNSNKQFILLATEVDRNNY